MARRNYIKVRLRYTSAMHPDFDMATADCAAYLTPTQIVVVSGTVTHHEPNCAVRLGANKFSRKTGRPIPRTHFSSKWHLADGELGRIANEHPDKEFSREIVERGLKKA